MAEESKFDLAAAVRREWWLVLAVAAVAMIATYLLTSGGVASYTGTAIVKVDYPAVEKYDSLLYGDRMLELIRSPEYYQTIAEETGIPEETLRKNLQTTAQGKFLDSVSIRYTAPSKEEAQSGAAAVADGFVVFATKVNEPETTRQAKILKLGEDAVAELTVFRDSAEKRGDENRQSALILQIAQVSQQNVSARSQLEAIQNAYAIEDEVKVAGSAASGLRADALAGALLAGLVAGVAVAALREWWTLRRERAA